MNTCEVVDCEAEAGAYVTDTKSPDCARHHVCTGHAKAWNERYAFLASGKAAPAAPVFRSPPPMCLECDRPVHARGLCKTHYNKRWADRTLDTVALPAGSSVRVTETRTVEVVATVPAEPVVEASAAEAHVIEADAVVVEPPAAIEKPAPAPLAASLDVRVSDLERRAEAGRALMLMGEDSTPRLEFSQGLLAVYEDRWSFLPEKEAIRDWLYDELRAVLAELEQDASSRIRARLRWLAFRPMDPPEGDTDDRPLCESTPPSFETRCSAIIAALNEAGGWHEACAGVLVKADYNDVLMLAKLGGLESRTNPKTHATEYATFETAYAERAKA